MTPAEFLALIYPRAGYGRTGLTLPDLIREQYRAYVRAYRVKSLYALCEMVACERRRAGLMQAVKDRDAGRPMIVIPELLDRTEQVT